MKYAGWAALAVAVVLLVFLTQRSGEQMGELHRECVAEYHALPQASQDEVSQSSYVHDCETAPYGGR